MHKKESLQQKQNKSNQKTTKSRFCKSDQLLDGVEILKPINFVFVGSEVLLFLNQRWGWIPAYEHSIEPGENWKNEIIRQNQEMGVVIEEDGLNLVGYIFSEKLISPNSISKTIQPITYSFAKKVDFNWISKTFPDHRANNEFDKWTDKENNNKNYSKTNCKINLKLVKPEKVSLLSSFTSKNSQILKIFGYINSVRQKDTQIEFEFIPNKILPDVDTTSAMTFCINQNKQVCIVKDANENFYSLPGGSRELIESIQNCAYRELLEEAQIEGCDFKIFGSILVKIKKRGKVVSQFQQARFLCRSQKINDFIPEKDGFETDQREFVEIDQLISKIRQFQNENGAKIINHLKSMISKYKTI